MATADLLDRCAFPDGELHLGVSGGADSVAMAVLARIAERPFTIWHIHHGVRPGADADAAFVEALFDGAAGCRVESPAVEGWFTLGGPLVMVRNIAG